MRLTLIILVLGSTLLIAGPTTNPYESPQHPVETYSSLAFDPVWSELIALSQRFRLANSSLLNGEVKPSVEELNILVASYSVEAEKLVSERFPNAQTKEAFLKQFAVTHPSQFADLASPVRLGLLRTIPLEELSAYRKACGPDIEELFPNENPTEGRLARRDIIMTEFTKGLDQWMKSRVGYRKIFPNTWTMMAGTAGGFGLANALQHPEALKYFQDNPRLAVLAVGALFVTPTVGRAVFNTVWDWNQANAALDAMEAAAGSKLLSDLERHTLLKSAQAESKLWWSFNSRCYRILRYLKGEIQTPKS